MIEYAKAVFTKAAGYASGTFLAGYVSEAAFDGVTVEALVVGGRAALVGALVAVVIPAYQRVAAKAAATKLPNP